MVFRFENGIKIYGIPPESPLTALIDSQSFIRVKEKPKYILAWLKNGMVVSVPKPIWRDMIEYFDEKKVVFRLNRHSNS